MSRNVTPGTIKLNEARKTGYNRNLSLYGESHRRAMPGAFEKHAIVGPRQPLLIPSPYLDLAISQEPVNNPGPTRYP
jgi:hypothetical protein